MEDQKPDLRRRRLLAATGALGGVVTVGAAVPFVASMNPSERARAAGAPVEVDIAGVLPGEQLTVEWRGRPVWILRRTGDMLAELGRHDDKLSDPASDVRQQPSYCKNATRSIKPEVFICSGLCTHLGCVPTLRKERGVADLGADWPGGYFCPCHGSKFDLAGRVFKGVPAPINLEIPPHAYTGETAIFIGADKPDR